MHKRSNRAPSRVRLTDCTACHQPFVQPDIDEIEALDNDCWHVVLCCGNCGDVREATITQAEADWFDYDLDAYMLQMERSLQRIAVENFEYDMSRFILALNADAILPEDFR